MEAFPGMNRIPAGERAAFNLLFLLEHYFPKSRRIQHMRESARRRAVAHLQRGPKGKLIEVQRVKDISASDFRKSFLSKGIPLIIENGSANWPLASRWSFEKFHQRYGHETIKLVQRKGVAADDEIIEGKEFSEEIQFGAFLDQVTNGGTKYMRFSPLLEKFPELLDDFDHDFFKRMAGNSWGLTYQLFMGATGTFTPMHNAMTSFFFVNVCGIKRWALIPNHYLPILNPSADGFGYNHSKAQADLSNVTDFPGLECIDRMEAVMQPGDILFLPSWMWHSVRNEAPTIGVRCGFIYPKGMATEATTLSFIRLFAARNPSTLEALYYVLFKRNLPERDKWLLTAKLIRR
ncbi:MAG: cupin-like domain-containing protein [Deltaproteobacteria bacterium]|nr:cupin-like domain-containing protein [Deltaproteobacteria bacterium]